MFVPSADCVVLDVNWCVRQGLLRTGLYATCAWDGPNGQPNSFRWTCHGPLLVWLEYFYLRSDQPEPERCHYRLILDRTQTPFGGFRSWFTCPECTARTARLYLPYGALRFLCRACHGLTYASQSVRQPRRRLWRNLERAQAQIDAPRLSPRKRLQALQRVDSLVAQLRSTHNPTLARLERNLAPSYSQSGPPPSSPEPGRISPLSSRAQRGTRRPDHEPLPTTTNSPSPSGTREPAPSSHPALENAGGRTPPNPLHLNQRPPGRPRQKRPYVRRVPLLRPPRQSPDDLFCIRCRAWRSVLDLQPIVWANGRPALRGRCAACAAIVTRLVKATVLNHSA